MPEGTAGSVGTPIVRSQNRGRLPPLASSIFHFPSDTGSRYCLVVPSVLSPRRLYALYFIVRVLACGILSSFCCFILGGHVSSEWSMGAICGTNLLGVVVFLFALWFGRRRRGRADGTRLASLTVWGGKK